MITKYQKEVLNGLLHEILLLRDKQCLRCSKPQFQASHIYPKGRYRKLEFDSQNIIALCYSCHIHFWHKNPIEAHDWLKQTLPKDWLDKLKLRSQTSGDGSRDYKTLKVFLNLELNGLKRTAENRR